MYPTAIILFREILEISIILSVVMAASRGVTNRGWWILAGIGGGVVGSAIVAYFTDVIADWIDGMGQEVFNAGILLVAVVMISWTVVWMKHHARELVVRLKHIGNKVQQGELPMYALATVISLCVWREGSEIVLFMYGILSTTEESLARIVMGGIGGAGAAAVIGAMIYFGLLKIPVRHFFTVTEWLLILLACGLSMQAAGYLIAADMIPALATQIWDTSHILPESNLIGQILHALFGYTDSPSAMQLVFYFTTMAVILAAMQLVKYRHHMELKHA